MPNTASSPSPSISHDPEAQRFSCRVDGELCVLDYRLNGAVAAFTHTGVPAAVGGRGIAAKLTRFALDAARAQGWCVQPVCSYVAAYMERHPEYQDLRA